MFGLSAAAAALGAGAAVWAGCASASGVANGFRRPSASEAAEIRIAIRAQPNICCANAKQNVTDIRISTVEPRFASAGVVAVRKGVQIGNAAVFLYRGVRYMGRERWAVLDFGTEFVGCWFAAPRIVHQLLGGACPTH
jgi:hypothetical protein